MKRYVDTDEWWPVYTLISEGYEEDEIELTVDEVYWIEQVNNSFATVQRFLANKLREKRGWA